MLDVSLYILCIFLPQLARGDHLATGNLHKVSNSQTPIPSMAEFPRFSQLGNISLQQSIPDSRSAKLISGCSFYSCGCSRNSPDEIRMSTIVRCSSAFADYGRDLKIAGEGRKRYINSVCGWTDLISSSKSFSDNGICTAQPAKDIWLSVDSRAPANYRTSSYGSKKSQHFVNNLHCKSGDDAMLPHTGAIRKHNNLQFNPTSSECYDSVIALQTPTR